MSMCILYLLVELGIPQQGILQMSYKRTSLTFWTLRGVETLTHHSSVGTLKKVFCLRNSCVHSRAILSGCGLTGLWSAVVGGSDCGGGEAAFGVEAAGSCDGGVVDAIMKLLQEEYNIMKKKTSCWGNQDTYATRTCSPLSGHLRCLLQPFSCYQ